MAIINITEARKYLYNLVDLANNSHEAIFISGKRGNAVLISEDDWSAINETLYLLSILKMREFIKKVSILLPTNAKLILTGELEISLYKAGEERCS